MSSLCALQEVESLEVLKEFVDEQRLEKYPHLVLVEGNDRRLIDVALISKLPIGAVTSWRHRTYQGEEGPPVFSRDLLQVEVLAPNRRNTILTVFVNHLKSRLARNEEERRQGDVLRKQQVETIAAILREKPPAMPYLVV